MQQQVRSDTEAGAPVASFLLEEYRFLSFHSNRILSLHLNGDIG